jgi:hypothetical protein
LNDVLVSGGQSKTLVAAEKIDYDQVVRSVQKKGAENWFAEPKHVNRSLSA